MFNQDMTYELLKFTKEQPLDDPMLRAMDQYLSAPERYLHSKPTGAIAKVPEHICGRLLNARLVVNDNEGSLLAEIEPYGPRGHLLETNLRLPLVFHGGFSFADGPDGSKYVTAILGFHIEEARRLSARPLPSGYSRLLDVHRRPRNDQSATLAVLELYESYFAFEQQLKRMEHQFPDLTHLQKIINDVFVANFGGPSEVASTCEVTKRSAPYLPADVVTDVLTLRASQLSYETHTYSKVNHRAPLFNFDTPLFGGRQVMVTGRLLDSINHMAQSPEYKARKHLPVFFGGWTPQNEVEYIHVADVTDLVFHQVIVSTFLDGTISVLAEQAELFKNITLSSHVFTFTPVGEFLPKGQGPVKDILDITHFILEPLPKV